MSNFEKFASQNLNKGVLNFSSSHIEREMSIYTYLMEKDQGAVVPTIEDLLWSFPANSC